MKADLTKNFESYGRQVMGFGGSRKSPKNGIPFLGNPINYHHDIPDSYFQAFCGVLQKRTGLAFLGVGCTTMACNPRFQQDNEYQRETVHVFLPMVLYRWWHCRILFILASTCLNMYAIDEHLPSPKKEQLATEISGWKVTCPFGARPIFKHQLTVSTFAVYLDLDHQLLGNATSCKDNYPPQN